MEWHATLRVVEGGLIGKAQVTRLHLLANPHL